MTNAEKHALVIRIYDRLNQLPSPANQMEFLEEFTSVLTDEQWEALQFAFEHPPAYKPVSPRVFEPRPGRAIKRRV